MGKNHDPTIEALRQALSTREPRPVLDQSLTPAAVLLLLYPRDGEHLILLNRRSDLVEHHKGEISFPGGGREPGDRDFLDTALREAKEELGIEPEDVTVLGQLDDVATRSHFGVRVFVGTIPSPYRFEPNGQEIAEVLEVPIRALVNATNRRDEVRWESGQALKSHSYAYDGNLVYGATAQILTQFLELLPPKIGRYRIKDVELSTEPERLGPPHQADIEQGLKKLPPSVLDKYERAKGRLFYVLNEEELGLWAAEGLTVANQTVRSWEAAVEYFKAAPEVGKYLPFVSFMQWARCGTYLSQDSPTLAVAFFKASPQSIPSLRAQYIPRWAGLGRSLYKGTWKSSTLAAKFFEVSPQLLRSLPFWDVEVLAALIEGLSLKSYDVSAECLVLAQGLLPKWEGTEKRFFLCAGP